MKIWKTLIVDDERLARNKLRSMLGEFSNIAVVGEADSATTAASLIEKTNPEIIFLDIHLTGASGFDLLERIETGAKIIFVTAYDEYAIRAFEVNALDYLLKPVSSSRLAQTVERLEQRTETATDKKLAEDDFIFVSSGKISKFIKIDSIKCILAADVYSEILIERGKFLLLKSLSDWEIGLPAKSFLRIHRSTIINLAFIERIEKKFDHSRRIYLHGIAEPFAISRRYQAKLKDKFG